MTAEGPAANPEPGGTVEAGPGPWPMRLAAVAAGLVTLAFLQSPGLIAADTKLDLTANPSGFLARALHMWDGLGFSGQVQNQAYGYLEPIGPFFMAGTAAGLPPWVVQRLWWSLILLTAFFGVYVLTRALGVRPPAAVVAGLLYATAPRVLTTLGPVSAEAWPMALAPWVVIPLALGHRGRLRLVPAGLLAAVAVGLMGGVNATLTLAATAPAVLLLASHRWARRNVVMTASFAAGTVLVTAWWVIPLFLLGRYSPPFLDYIETAATTTSTTDLVDTLRGVSMWVAYLSPELGSTWRAGHDYVTVDALILYTGLIAVLGLWGLTRRDLPEAAWLRLTLLLGLALVTMGHAGPLAAPFADDVRVLLDGPLAPLRNVHKFDVLIRLAIVVGVAHVLDTVPRQLRHHPILSPVGPLVIAVVLVAGVGAAAPALLGRVAPAGSYPALPGYWTEAADWLEEHPRGRTILAPAARFADFAWGSTQDEPLQALSTTPWDVRNVVPLTPPGHVRTLDEIERIWAGGRPDAAIAQHLSDLGFGYVLVRQDLKTSAAQATRADLVLATLQTSPGFRRVAGFGPVVGSGDAPSGHLLRSPSSSLATVIEIWSVDPQPPSATERRVQDVVILRGGPEDLPAMAQELGTSAGSVVLASQRPTNLPVERLVVTDGNQRRERDMGRSGLNASEVLAPDDPGRLGRPAQDYAVSVAPHDQTVRDWVGAERVTVSSSTAEATQGADIESWHGVRAALDATPSTTWLTADASVDTNPKLTVSFATPTVVGDLVLDVPEAAVDRIESVTVTTDGDRAVSRVVESRTVVPLLRTSTLDVQITLERADDPWSQFGLEISDLLFTEHEIAPVLRTPVLEPARQRALLYRASGPRFRGGCVGPAPSLWCSPALAQAGEEDGGFSRVTTVTRPGLFRVGARVRPGSGAAFDDLVFAEASVRTSASSVALDAFGSTGGAAADGLDHTAWLADPNDPAPWLDLAFDSAATVSALSVRFPPAATGTAPSTLTVSAVDDSGNEVSTDIRVAGQGLLSFPPVTTDRLRLTLRGQPRTVPDPASPSVAQVLPLGIAEVTVPGVRTPTLDLERQITTECGEGPRLTVGGQLRDTAVTASLRSLLIGGVVAARVCGDAQVEVPAGDLFTQASATAAWVPVSVTLTEDGWSNPPRPLTRETEELGPHAYRLSAARLHGERLLAVPHNWNVGWRGRVDSGAAQSLPVAGAMQAYVVPAGTRTVVTTFTPGSPYRWSLGLGLPAALTVVLAAVVGGYRRRRQDHPAVALSVDPRGPALWTSALVMLALGGWVGLGVAVALLVSLTALRERSWVGHAPGAVAALASAVAVTLAAAYPWASPERDVVSPVMQLLCLVAVAAVAVAGISPGPRAKPADESGARAEEPVQEVGY